MASRLLAVCLLIAAAALSRAGAREYPVVPSAQEPLSALRLYEPASAEDSLRTLEELRERVARDRNDVESRRELASLLSHSDSIPLRLEAADVLNRALILAPEDPDLWVRLGLLRLRQKYWSESRRALEKAWRLAPDWVYVSDILAQIQLAEFQRSDREEYYEKARLYNRRLFEAGEAGPTAYKREIRLAFMHGDTVAVIDSLLDSWEEAGAVGPWYHLIRGWRLFREDQWEEAAAAFERGKQGLPPAQRGDFFTLHIVAPRFQQLTRELPDSVRAIRDWWRWKDPTPGDLLNPRYLEHEARMVEADLLFGLERKRVPGWRHAPGEMVVRYGLPPDFNYFDDVSRHVGRRLFNTSHYQPTALLVRYGAQEEVRADFIDFAMNGTFVRSFDRNLDEFVFARPSAAPLPFEADPKFQEIEVWRFGPPGTSGRLDIAVALPRESWKEDVLARDEDLITRVAMYDSLWAVVDTARWEWGGFHRDPFGRLVSLWSVHAPPDSLVLGLETEDRAGDGWAGTYRILNPHGPGAELALSDLGFYRNLEVREDTPYARSGLSALPNPGHVYLPGEAVVLGFEAYGLEAGDAGDHRARVVVSVMRPGRKGVLKILMGEGASRQGLNFETAGAGSRSEQLFALDMPYLTEGEYVVEVRVTDLKGNDTVAVRDKITVADRIKR